VAGEEECRDAAPPSRPRSSLKLNVRLGYGAWRRHVNGGAGRS